MARNWTPNTGKCPVVTGTLVDVIHRDGEAFKSVAVSVHWSVCSTNWLLEECIGDIIFWRRSKEKKQ